MDGLLSFLNDRAANSRDYIDYMALLQFECSRRGGDINSINAIPPLPSPILETSTPSLKDSYILISGIKRISIIKKKKKKSLDLIFTKVMCGVCSARVKYHRKDTERLKFVPHHRPFCPAGRLI